MDYRVALALACAFRRSHCCPDKRQPKNYTEAAPKYSHVRTHFCQNSCRRLLFDSRYGLQQSVGSLESGSLNVAENLLVELGNLLFQKSQMSHREANQNSLGFAHSMTFESGLYLRDLLLGLFLRQFRDLLGGRLALC